MSRQTLQLDDRLHRYLTSRGVRESEALRQLREETGELSESNMQIAPEQGQFMAFLVDVTGAEHILEIGTFTGYSALWMARALGPDGRLRACDKCSEWAKMAKDYWEKAGVLDRIDLYLGLAEESMRDFLDDGEVFDFIFIDADKENYETYYELGLELLTSDGIIALDNTLWSGAVADPEDDRESTWAIRQINDRIRDDDSVNVSMVPIGDGLTLVTPV